VTKLMTAILASYAFRFNKTAPPTGPSLHKLTKKKSFLAGSVLDLKRVKVTNMRI
jgi:hypothetical protein